MLVVNVIQNRQQSISIEKNVWPYSGKIVQKDVPLIVFILLCANGWVINQTINNKAVRKASGHKSRFWKAPAICD